jgi:hypothetical protein
MGRGWAVGASTSLALAVTQLVLQQRERGQTATGMGEPVFLLETLALVLALAAWAYAISTGSHGSKGALVGLIGYALVFGAALEGVVAFLPGYDAHPPIVAILSFANLGVGLGTTASLAREVRERRGPVQWGTAAFYLAPLALRVALWLAARQVGG